jgi:hypothetical protein
MFAARLLLRLFPHDGSEEAYAGAALLARFLRTARDWDRANRKKS